MPKSESVVADDAGAVTVTVGSEFTVITGVVAVACWLFESVSVTMKAQLLEEEVGWYVNAFTVWDVYPGQLYPDATAHE
jgi:hypothetical protein